MFTVTGRLLGVIAALAIAGGGAWWSGHSVAPVEGTAATVSASGLSVERLASNYFPVCSVPTSSVTFENPFSAR